MTHTHITLCHFRPKEKNGEKGGRRKKESATTSCPLVLGVPHHFVERSWEDRGDQRHPVCPSPWAFRARSVTGCWHPLLEASGNTQTQQKTNSSGVSGPPLRDGGHRCNASTVHVGGFTRHRRPPLWRPNPTTCSTTLKWPWRFASWQMPAL